MLWFLVFFFPSPFLGSSFFGRTTKTKKKGRSSTEKVPSSLFFLICSSDFISRSLPPSPLPMEKEGFAQRKEGLKQGFFFFFTLIVSVGPGSFPNLATCSESENLLWLFF